MLSPRKFLPSSIDENCICSGTRITRVLFHSFECSKALIILGGEVIVFFVHLFFTGLLSRFFKRRAKKWASLAECNRPYNPAHGLSRPPAQARPCVFWVTEKNRFHLKLRALSFALVIDLSEEQQRCEGHVYRQVQLFQGVLAVDLVASWRREFWRIARDWACAILNLWHIIN